MENIIKELNDEFKRCAEELTKIFEDGIGYFTNSTHKETSKQLLVKVDERFINWIYQVESGKHNLKFDIQQDIYVFVRIYDGEACDITGFTQIDSADGLVKTVGKEKHETYHVFDIKRRRELKSHNKAVWE